jgi:hypothetical protein
MKITVLSCLLSILAGPQLFAQETVLTNNEVIEMVKAHLAPSLIISQIQGSKANFDLSTSELIRLSKDGVPETVIAAMRNPKGTTTVAAIVPTRTLKLGDGEKVRMIQMEDISSSTANQGDRVQLSVCEDLKVGDVVVVAKGAIAAGTISEAKRKGMLGKGGKLTMSLDYVKAVDGQNIRIRATSGREGDDKLGKTVAIAILAGPFALLVKGKDVASPKGTEYTAYTDESKDIVTAK